MEQSIPIEQLNEFILKHKHCEKCGIAIPLNRDICEECLKNN